MHRPTTAALLWAAATQEPAAIFVGVFFELLWLDLFPAGAYIPPNGLLATCLAMVTLAQSPDPTLPTALAVLVGAALCGHGAANVELVYRKRQDAALMRLADANRRARLPQFAPDPIVSRAVAEQWVLGWGMFLVFAAIMQGGLHLLAWLPLPRIPVSWPVLLAPALAGGLLALRTRRAVATAAAALGGLIVLRLMAP